MELRVNGQPYALNLGVERTFGEVMDTLYRTIISNTQVVTRVAVNGEQINEEREQALAALPKDDIATLEIITKHPLDLADEAMRAGLEYLLKLMEALRKNAKSFRLKDSLPVAEDFQSCVEGLQWFFELLNGLKGPLHLVHEQEALPGKTFQQLETEAANAIHELCEAREKKDGTVIADAIEYGLLPSLENWRQWLVKMTDLEATLRELK